MNIPLDRLFASTNLNVFVPEPSFEFPPRLPTDEWLNTMTSEITERQKAFFDEQLQSFLLLRIDHPEGEPFNGARSPPDSIVDLLCHVQVSSEASYISSVPNTTETPRTSRLLATPRTGAISKPSGRLNPHPSILPPSTPIPTPATADSDRKYTASEGTLLSAQIWGANTADDSQEAFALLWSEEENNWIAVYRLALTVSFLKLSFNSPLLCLTVSATLREKPFSMTAKHPLSEFLTGIGRRMPIPPESPTEKGIPIDSDPCLLDGLGEVNLLEGLHAAPNFGKTPSAVDFPSIRLGTVSRQNLFLLPPMIENSPIQPSPSPLTVVRKAHPTLRKSYRKTLQTASGFRVRMRTVFVPYVLLPETEGTVEDLEETEKERARREAGSAEKTVVLCVEIENFGDMGQDAGFLVENVHVLIGGDGAKAILIGWGDHGFTPDAAKMMFPLRIGPSAQHNLLYAVTFIRSPEEVDTFSFARSTSNAAATDLHRSVTINIVGKPFFPNLSKSRSLIPDPSHFSYPTQAFSSRWNCVLDLSAQQTQPSDSLDANDPSHTRGNVMPEPASPFPPYSLYSGTPKPYSAAGSTPLYSATAGSKRFTLAASSSFTNRTLKILTPNKTANTNNDRDSLQIASSRPPSRIGGAVTPNSAAHYLRSPTTYSAPPPPLISFSNQTLGHQGETEEGTQISGIETPITPAFPPFPPKSTLPATPASLGPISSSSHGNIGQSVEIKRNRGSLIGGVPATPLPFVSGAFGEQKILAKMQDSSSSGENIVVSVGLLPLPHINDGKEVILGLGKIYPLHVFTLDIFVFNQSLWPRRFEITCPEKRRRKRGGFDINISDGGTEAARKMGYPGVLPLESRVRIGPLRPSACQSVRMDFLAVSPGVHSIDVLTLTDTETGFSMNLRSVLDVVVHDPND